MPPLFIARRMYNGRAAGYYHARRGVSHNGNRTYYSVHEITPGISGGLDESRCLSWQNERS